MRRLGFLARWKILVRSVPLGAIDSLAAAGSFFWHPDGAGAAAFTGERAGDFTPGDHDHTQAPALFSSRRQVHGKQVLVVEPLDYFVGAVDGAEP
jgi:hypothetical protein